MQPPSIYPPAQLWGASWHTVTFAAAPTGLQASINGAVKGVIAVEAVNVANSVVSSSAVQEKAVLFPKNTRRVWAGFLYFAVSKICRCDPGCFSHRDTLFLYQWLTSQDNPTAHATFIVLFDMVGAVVVMIVVALSVKLTCFVFGEWKPEQLQGSELTYRSSSSRETSYSELESATSTAPSAVPSTPSRLSPTSVGKVLLPVRERQLCDSARALSRVRVEDKKLLTTRNKEGGERDLRCETSLVSSARSWPAKLAVRSRRAGKLRAALLRVEAGKKKKEREAYLESLAPGFAAYVESVSWKMANEAELEGASIRYRRLARALEQRGLQLRADSFICKEFITSGYRMIDDVVDTMEEMSFLYAHTEYARLRNGKIMAFQDEWGGWFPQATMSDAASVCRDKTKAEFNFNSAFNVGNTTNERGAISTNQMSTLSSGSRMLINGPAEWSEALVATGDKSNLLQNGADADTFTSLPARVWYLTRFFSAGYNSKLQVSAMSLGPTVVITRYADTMTGFARGILGQPNDSLVLHEDSSDSGLLENGAPIGQRVAFILIMANDSYAQNHTLHCFSWADPDSLLSGLPKHDQINVSSSGGKGLLLDTSVGPIGAVARVSPTICILATDTKLIVEGISRADLVISAMGTERRETLSAGSDNSPSLLLRPESPYRLNIREQCSNQSSLQILNRVDLTSPIDEQEMRVIVGSCLSPRLVVAHLDVSDRMEWTASFSGELELPPTHVCRGIYLAEKSPFADIASTEKSKRATFFHAPANTQPQPVFLSRFKVPRRTRPTSNTKPPGSAQEPPAIAADKTTKSSADGGSGGENKDLLELILAKVTAMQTQLNARFDDVDKKLQHLTARVEQIERNGGTCAKHV
ncbi:hypothetical protein ON010_g10517 [Phytophthora cinnamomi]|nr:hypothetical protein ON010_g10517 [Phytophthora cinnamomi]